jgi:group I intron endonuclease
MIIYKTINLINGKIYIGKDEKNNPSYLGSGKILKIAIKKYGRNNFKKEIIEICSSVKELNLKEQYWIKYFNSTNRTIGYNITAGGSGGDIFTHNPNKEIIRERLRLTSSQKTHTQATKEKISKLRSGTGNGMYKKPAWNRGVPMSVDQKQKLKEINTGKFIGVKRSKETREKISNALKGKEKTETHKQKISSTLTGRKLSDTTKHKMSLARRGRSQKKLTCPYCHKTGGTAMNRWHFENCKQQR